MPKIKPFTHTTSFFSLPSLLNSSSSILRALNLSLWQDSSWSDLSAFRGETTTTNVFGGKIFAFPVHGTGTEILVDESFSPMPGRQANVSRLQGLDLLVNPKLKQAYLLIPFNNSYSIEQADEHTMLTLQMRAQLMIAELI